MSNTIYRKATDEEVTKIAEQATEWFGNAPAKVMFNDCKSITRSSVAEFIANQQGLTLYASVDGANEPLTEEDDLDRAKIRFDILDMLKGDLSGYLLQKIDRLLEEDGKVLDEYRANNKNYAIPKDIIIAIGQWISDQYQRPQPSRGDKMRQKRFFRSLSQWGPQ